MGHKIKINKEQIETMHLMYKQGKSRQDIGAAIGKSVKDVGELLNEYHILGEMPTKDYEKEMDFSETIRQFWDKMGYHVEMKTTVYGYNRTDMVNGLPRAIKKYNNNKHGEIKEWTKKNLTPIATSRKAKKK